MSPHIDALTAPNRARDKILVVDDLAANVASLEQLLTCDGHTVCVARNGTEALEAVNRERPDLVLLDVMMPGMSGFEVCNEIKRNPTTRLTPVVLLTALTDTEDRVQGIEAGADDFLSKPVNVAELRARVRSLLQLKRYTDDLDSAESVIMSLALTIEARDVYTVGHCQRLATYATALGTQLTLDDDDLAALHRGGFLHDVGKVGIADAILHKRGHLSSEEYAQMKEHTVIGDRLCGELRSLRRVRPIVRHHHERLDGSGYPDGLEGDQIPLLAQVMGIVDVYDALTTDRPYRRAFTADVAFEMLREEVAQGWRRRDLVDAFTAMRRRGSLQHTGADTCATVRLRAHVGEVERVGTDPTLLTLKTLADTIGVKVTRKSKTRGGLPRTRTRGVLRPGNRRRGGERSRTR